MFRPRCGRKLKSQSSREGSQRREGLGPRPHHDHAAWSPPAADRRAILARIPPLPGRPPGRPGPLPNHRPQRRPSRSRPAAGSARPVPASRARLQPRADDAPSWTRRAITPTPAIPAVRLPAPPPRPTTSFPSDTTDAGGRTLDTWTLRRPHRTPVTWTGPAGQRTLAPDTGHRTPDTGQERGHGDDSTAGVRTSLAATPSDRTLRRPTVFALSHYQPAPRPLRRPSSAPAHCCPQTITGRA
jgi:hypothetical protein